MNTLESNPSEITAIIPQKLPACENSVDRFTCSELYNCCDCGGSGCGCRYCWSCNACETCMSSDE